MRYKTCFEDAEPVTLEEMLDARELRAVKQRVLISRYEAPLICLTLNIPGEYKAYPLAIRAFEEGKSLIESALKGSAIPVLHSEGNVSRAGCEGYYCVECPAPKLKKLMLSIEEYHPIGRLFDIDVLDVDHTAARGENYGRAERRCIICGKPVWECSRGRTHSAELLAVHTARWLDDYYARQYADTVSCLAVRALLYEVNVTPKPGLVDRENSGSHKDMDIFTFLDSSCSLIPYFRDITFQAQQFDGEPEQLLSGLRFLGQQAEEIMLAGTNGVNTHKGLIFSLGIVCAAFGYLNGHGKPISEDSLFDLCSRIAKESTDELKNPSSTQKTNGQEAFERHRISGIRGEAALGFPHVRSYGYPALVRSVQNGLSLNDAGIVALLHLMAHVDDTNMIHRSDIETLNSVKKEMLFLLQQEYDVKQLIQKVAALDKEFITNNLSPGGCADLLAISFMAYFAVKR